MKMTKINIKNLFLGLILAGTASLVNAQTTKTDSANNTANTAATAQTGSNSTIDGLKKQIEANPKDTEALSKLATAYQEASDWTNAVETWKKISVLLPDWAPSYYSQAYAYQSAKDDANAKIAYEKYIATVKPEEVEQNKKNLAYAYFYLAFTEQKSDPNKAKEHIAKSLEYDPTNQDALKLSKVLNS
ncbi:tetratricopeptide repeat protein [Chryseobacterium lathyri]|uniref:Tetratricopeptide (TPR) repeat protein n=1 Tax=Chryseobacterium lathyri TaxID=395933 RepID=A0ABT9SKM2_9FLAO|nr:tetratricopeptide repeat protein [Chryseobacterium lathyri]MDP9959972.1 tetratricopeptide (TPR) repeat protein [Chryseobacterium lathyri]MDQ0064473.1 tetratricopeptide (TPR) repeat protein [Chryseobacterium lathyri]